MNKITARAIKGDGEAILEIYALADYVDGAAAEIFSGHIFAIIHYWRDSDLAAFLKNLPEQNRKDIAFFLTQPHNTFPIEEPIEYYRLYFPLTLRAIASNK